MEWRGGRYQIGDPADTRSKGGALITWSVQIYGSGQISMIPDSLPRRYILAIDRRWVSREDDSEKGSSGRVSVEKREREE